MDEALRGYKFVCIRQTNSELKRELCRLRGGHLAGMTVDDSSARARIKTHIAKARTITADGSFDMKAQRSQDKKSKERQRTLPRRLCAQNSPSSALRDLSH